MDPYKNVVLLTAACRAVGMKRDGTPFERMGWLMHMPPPRNQQSKKPRDEPANISPLIKATYVSHETQRIMNYTRPPGRVGNKSLATIEAHRRWEHLKKKTLRDDDASVPNEGMAVRSDEIRHNGWVLVLVDDTHHYYRFPVTPPGPVAAPVVG